MPCLCQKVCWALLANGLLCRTSFAEGFLGLQKQWGTGVQLTHNGSPVVDNMVKRVWVKSRKSQEHKRNVQLFLEFPASGLPCLILNLGGTEEDEIILTPGFLKSQQLEYDTRNQMGEKKSRRENRNQISLLDFKCWRVQRAETESICRKWNLSVILF